MPGLLDGLFGGGGMQAQAPGQGLLGGGWNDFTTRVKDVQQNNPEAFMALGAGLLSGDMSAGVAGMGAAMGDYRQDQRRAQLMERGWDRDDARFAQTFGLQQQQFDLERQTLGTERAQAQQQASVTAGWMRSQGWDDLAAMAEAGAGADAMRIALTRQKGGGGVRLSTEPVWGQDAEGNDVLGQMGSDNTFHPTQMPDGVAPVSPYGINEQRARGRAIGTAAGEKIAGAPTEITQAGDSIALIDSILTDPLLPSATGWQAKLPTVYSETRDVEAKVQQLGGQAFLQAIQQLRGMGALSNAEGQTATAAIARLRLDQSDAGFKTALMELRSVMERGKAKAEAIMGGRSAQTPGVEGGGGSRQTRSGLNWSAQ